MIISSHLPKTAGTSFKAMLREHVLSKVHFDYGDRIVDRSAGAEMHRAKRETEVKVMFGSGFHRRCTIIHGHFYLTKYGFMNPASTHYVTVLRDPAAMLHSYYHYIRTRPGTNLLIQMVSPMTFVEFVSHPWFQDIFSSLLCGKRPRQFSLIGFQDSFDQFVRVFSEKFLEGQPLSLASENVGSYSREEALDGDTLALIKKLNPADYDLYNESRDVFSGYYS